MYKGRTVGVVVTAYDEARFVGEVLETVPDFVDRIYAIDDASPDESWDVICGVAERVNETESVERAVTDGGDRRRIVPIRHEENRGYGAAVKTGYERAAADGIDVVAVMNGDGQMDPAILDRIVDPVATGEADYAKGNRLLTPADREDMSRFRLFGNAMLTGLSKFASGYWTIGDPQNGYTAISRAAIEDLDLEAITDRYGFLNHILTHLNVADRCVADVSMSAVYGEEESSIRYVPFVRYVSLLLLRSFYWRLKRQYVIEGFHPAAVFYATGTSGLAGGVAGFCGAAWERVRRDDVTGLTGVIAAFATVVLGLLALGIAIAMDADENDPLEVTRYETSENRAGHGSELGGHGDSYGGEGDDQPVDSGTDRDREWRTDPTSSGQPGRSSTDPSSERPEDGPHPLD
ncbi:glycosyltransferase family 2 protein [Salinadaptatus halalkaliphilus]|uniref:Glycosyltransferase family 2 protein n=1 Tax=Salinadaptatus halalkaliphilus TaxID=2419781 RepID=A0A4S3TK87_9EURY|nr:glycosyltransferase family 2 protein [Salinadaptatus halalkaliphilus]THE62988.1 glycosyltransferase family 2 protein [Salinadaptatus halalkaliphilus]